MLVGVVHYQIGTCRKPAQIDCRHFLFKNLSLLADHALPLLEGDIQHVGGLAAMPGQQHRAHQKALRCKGRTEIVE